MAVNLTIALATGLNGTSPHETGMVQEVVTITGSSSSANDTGVYQTIMKNPQMVISGVTSYSISGQNVTFLDEVGLGNAVAGATILGYQ